MAQDWGYDEINFNVGCPSPRVCSGNFGASLMKEPSKVAKCTVISNNMPWSGQPSTLLGNNKCAELDIGKNSVIA